MQSSTSQSTATILPPINDIPDRPRLDLEQNEIRVLTLHAGLWPDPVRCSLRTARLEDNPYYEALSYAWGDPAIRLPIFLDGSVCHVTANLAAALRRLRHLNRDRQLWVDALCINQSDDVEKSHQVNLMSVIYSATAEGLLWLGDYEEGGLLSDTGDPLLCVRSNTNNTSPGAYPGMDCPSHGTQHDGPESEATITRTEAARAFSLIQAFADWNASPLSTAALNTALGADSAAAAAVNSLLNLPWWSRIWTVQEAVLPHTKSFICGSLQIPFSTCSRARDAMLAFESKEYNSDGHRYTYAVLRRFCNAIGPIINLHVYKARGVWRGPGDTLVYALNVFSHRLASDPRDKVYALLGLVGDESGRPSPRRPDYSLHWRQVYRRTALEIVTATKSLHILAVLAGPATDPLLPSWVPDWHQTDQASQNHKPLWIGAYPKFDCSLNSQVVLGASSEDELALQGIQLDRIRALGKNSKPTFYHEMVKSARGWHGLLEQSVDFRGPYPHGGTYAQAFSRLLTHDLFVESGLYRRLGPTDVYAVQTDWWTEIDKSNATNIVSPLNQTFFMTEGGLIGLGPPWVSIGDILYVIRGGRVPLILRPACGGARQSCFTLHGFAYVHGVMDGEAVPDACDWQWLTLV